MSSTVEVAREIRPFHVDVSDEALDDLRRRVTATNWPEEETVANPSQGLPLAMIRELARYWATDYDWRRCEATLMSCRSSWPRSMVLLSTSFTFVRNMNTGCR
jgi:hypothetical protein